MRCSANRRASPSPEHVERTRRRTLFLRRSAIGRRGGSAVPARRAARRVAGSPWPLAVAWASWPRGSASRDADGRCQAGSRLHRHRRRIGHSRSRDAARDRRRRQPRHPPALTQATARSRAGPAVTPGDRSRRQAGETAAPPATASRRGRPSPPPADRPLRRAATRAEAPNPPPAVPSRRAVPSRALLPARRRLRAGAECTIARCSQRDELNARRTTTSGSSISDKGLLDDAVARVPARVIINPRYVHGARTISAAS